MKALYDLPAPAKLNLFLHVVGQRADGYHLLQSVFMLIDWCDVLHVELRSDGRLSREDLGAPLPADDLVLAAARALQAHARPSQGAHIGIDKRIPMQAGMGGGSSDAATCLIALNRLWNLGLDRKALQEIGLQLGADVPFFLGGQNAWVEGIGEQMMPIELPAGWFCVAKPAAGIDTRGVFAAPDLRRNTAPVTPAAIIAGFAATEAGAAAEFGEGSLPGVDSAPQVPPLTLSGFGGNDLQPVAERLCPAIGEAIAWFGNRGLAARMTGSGSAVFAALPDGWDADGRDATPESRYDFSDLPGQHEGWTVRVCSNLAVHPLAGWADSEVWVN